MFVIWFSLLLSIASAQIETFVLLNLDTGDLITYNDTLSLQQNATTIHHPPLLLPIDDITAQEYFPVSMDTSEGTDKELKSDDDKAFVQDSSVSDTTKDEQIYECCYPGCTMIIKNYDEYAKHTKTHDESFIHKCKMPGCGRTFNCDSSFRSHKQRHQPYHRCGSCEQMEEDHIWFGHWLTK
ncbi:Uncharacterized protein BM_BM17798 [Brugia malayi]|uniref:C2H2-type domain-containing protein n=1 Tax=Brugia malayi TaxID=6279 RepID=A0A4E9FSX5_BRUMA|nr:Uncharacterized protein BM_BM17798 [Brugia malayi]VIO99159.1 Uncharacterized protein BM_BM17798 [Brugia malayi]